MDHRKVARSRAGLLAWTWIVVAIWAIQVPTSNGRFAAFFAVSVVGFWTYIWLSER